MFRKTRHIHFIGIGGIGMSGMAELLQKLGFIISGSDTLLSERTNQLSELGIQIYDGHEGSNVLDSDVVVYSSAVPQNNPEIIEAIQQNIPVIRRAEMLGELLKVKPISIGVAGTHGKTSTSSILGAILTDSKLDPTLVIGGIVNKFQTNAISGDGDVIVVEADECRGDAEKMVRKFIKKVKRDGIIDEFKDRTYYKKPSVLKGIRKATRQRLIDKVNKKRLELFTPTNKKRSNPKSGRRK